MSGAHQAVYMNQRSGLTFDLAFVQTGTSGGFIISIYPFSGGFKTRYANLASHFGGLPSAVAFSPDGDFIAVSSNLSPFVHLYSWIRGVGWGSKYADPATLPSFATGVAFGLNGDIAFTTGGSSLVGGATALSVYKYSSAGFGNKYADINFSPHTVTSSVRPRFGPRVPGDLDRQSIAIVHTNSPFVTVYKFRSSTTGIGGFEGVFSNPATLPTGGGRDVNFSSSGADIAVGHDTSPAMSVYPWDTTSGFGAKYADPASLPGTNRFGVAFSPTDNTIATVGAVPDAISAYSWTSGVGFGTRYIPSPSPFTIAQSVQFSPDNTSIAFASASSGQNPRGGVYPFGESSGFGTRYSGPATSTLPFINNNDYVAFCPVANPA